MYPDNGTPTPSVCAEGSGSLPECAPLAVPYVPYQPTNCKRFTQQEALNNGTLFPALNLPFRVKPDARNVVSGPMAELQALEFVLIELAIYLDTHPGDSEAFELYKQYCALEKTARAKCEAQSGPLTLSSVSAAKGWGAWLSDPWPWNYSAKEAQ